MFAGIPYCHRTIFHNADDNDEAQECSHQYTLTQLADGSVVLQPAVQTRLRLRQQKVDAAEADRQLAKLKIQALIEAERERQVAIEADRHRYSQLAEQAHYLKHQEALEAKREEGARKHHHKIRKELTPNDDQEDPLEDLLSQLFTNMFDLGLVQENEIGEREDRKSLSKEAAATAATAATTAATAATTPPPLPDLKVESAVSDNIAKPIEVVEHVLEPSSPLVLTTVSDEIEDEIEDETEASESDISEATDDEKDLQGSGAPLIIDVEPSPQTSTPIVTGWESSFSSPSHSPVLTNPQLSEVVVVIPTGPIISSGPVISSDADSTFEESSGRDSIEETPIILEDTISEAQAAPETVFDEESKEDKSHQSQETNLNDEISALNDSLLEQLFAQTQSLYARRATIVTKIKTFTSNPSHSFKVSTLQKSLKQIDALIDQTHRYTQEILDQDIRIDEQDSQPIDEVAEKQDVQTDHVEAAVQDVQTDHVEAAVQDVQGTDQIEVTPQVIDQVGDQIDDFSDEFDLISVGSVDGQYQ